jgi:hypothetical protein
LYAYGKGQRHATIRVAPHARQVWPETAVPGAANKLFFHLQPSLNIEAGHRIVITGLTGSNTPSAPSFFYKCPDSTGAAEPDTHTRDKPSGRATTAACSPKVLSVTLTNIAPPEPRFVRGGGLTSTSELTATACGDAWQTQVLVLSLASKF